MAGSPFVILAAALALWLASHPPIGPRPSERTGRLEQLARDLAIAHQDAVARAQAGQVASAGGVAALAGPPAHPDQSVWWPVSCSDGVRVATYAGPARPLDEAALFAAVDALLDRPLTVGVARGGAFVRHGVALAALPCPIADAKTVLLTQL